MARPENYLELRQQAENTPEQPSQRTPSLVAAVAGSQGGVDLSSALNAASLITLGDSNFGVGALQTPSREANTRADTSQNSLEHVRQDILTMHTLLSTMSITSDDTNPHQQSQKDESGDMEERRKAPSDLQDSLNEEILDNPSQEKMPSRESNEATSSPTPSSSNTRSDGYNGQNKQFFVGQWLDVKDTVNQWLEATVLEMNEEQGYVFVHYNGWPSRWDEWISVESPRIAPFRTRTTHSNSSTHISPTPNTAAPHAPITGRDDIRAIIPEVTCMLARLSPVLSEIAGLSERSTIMQPELYDYTESNAQVASNMPWRSSPEKPHFLQLSSLPTNHENVNGTAYPLDDLKAEEETEKVASCRMSSEGEEEMKARDDERLKYLAGELSPLLDRMGRALTDLAPHLRSFSDSPNTLRRQSTSQEESKTSEDETNVDSVGNQEFNPSDLPRASSGNGDSDGNNRDVNCEDDNGNANGQESIQSTAATTNSQIPTVDSTNASTTQSTSTETTPAAIRTGMDTLEALTSILRSRRAPSPPPERVYRQNISTSNTRGGLAGLGLGGNNHVDIHIHAILTPTGTPGATTASTETNQRTTSATNTPATTAIASTPDSVTRTDDDSRASSNQDHLPTSTSSIPTVASVDTVRGTSLLDRTSTTVANARNENDNPFAPDILSLETTAESMLSQIIASEDSRTTSDRSRSSRSSVFANNNYVSASSTAQGGGGRVARRGVNASGQSSPLLGNLLAKGGEDSVEIDCDIDCNNYDDSKRSTKGSKKKIPSVRKDIGTFYTKDSNRVEEDDGHVGIHGNDFIDDVSEDEYEKGKKSTILSPEKKPAISRRSLSEERTISEQMEMMSAEESMEDFIAQDEISGANRNSCLNRYIEDLLINSERTESSRSSSALSFPPRKPPSSQIGLQPGKTKRIRNVNNFPIVEEADCSDLDMGMVSQLDATSDLQADLLTASSETPTFEAELPATTTTVTSTTVDVSKSPTAPASVPPLLSSPSSSSTNSERTDAVSAVQMYVNETLHNSTTNTHTEVPMSDNEKDNDSKNDVSVSGAITSDEHSESASKVTEEVTRPTQSIMERIRRSIFDFRRSSANSR